MAYPKITLKECNYAQVTQTKQGDLAQVYKPLQNLIKDNALGEFTTEKLNFSRYNAQDMLIVDEFDGSTNIILNDDKNQPRLINSGFSVQEDNTFLIPEHYTNTVENIYNDDVLGQDTQLFKLYTTIPELEFLGLGDGSFQCGSYIFYFRLADSYGNMSNVIQHSSVVQVHVGEVGAYQVRMGMQDENAGKSVSFKLSGLDGGFDYIRVFYERTSSDNSGATATAFFMIDQNFPISNGTSTITLTGAEQLISVQMSDLKNEYADVAACKTHTIVDNTLFLANTSAFTHEYDKLQKLAWTIYAEQVTEDIDMPDTYVANKKGKGYYDMSNVYYNVGYWPDEFYRFGIVFVYDNNQLSPVFNIQGHDLNKLPDNDVEAKNLLWNWHNSTSGDSGKYEFFDSDPDNSIFDASIMSNSKGVVRLKEQKFSCSQSSAENIKIKFNLQGLNEWIKHSTDLSAAVKKRYYREGHDDYDVQAFLKQYHGIKGFFFVRQKRIPTVLAQGLVIGLTHKDHGCLPILQDNNIWKTKSFLSPGRLVLPWGSTTQAPASNVSTKALLVPDAELQEATYNQIFTSQEYALKREGNVGFQVDENDMWWEFVKYDKDTTSDDSDFQLSKLTAVPKDTKMLTNGSDYFSTLAGSPEEASKTEDVEKKWNKTVPQDLTTSTTLVRGKWGYYVGLSNDSFNFGDIVSIKKAEFKKNPENQNLLEFQARFSDHSFYSPISPRYNVSSIGDDCICAGGDCYPSLFTHRMMSNFIDPELPTNTKIVDPGCWAKNYAVRCTAEILSGTHSNLTGDSAGFYLPSPKGNSAVVSLVFGILTGNIGTIIQAAKQLNEGPAKLQQEEFANEIATAFEVYTGMPGTQSEEYDIEKYNNPIDAGNYTENTGWQEVIEKGKIKKVTPAEQEQTSSGLNLKALFKSDDKWELHGVAQINRADINAVSFGQWITFPFRSSMNVALRDVDFNNVTEEASFNKKRGFYPLEPFDTTNKLHESNIINGATKKSVHKNTYAGYKTVPFIKQEYFNRIYWSKPNTSESFINSFRMVYSDQFKEYNKEFGTITKILPLQNNLFVVFDHGLGVLPIDRSIKNDAEASPYLASRNVLPAQVQTLSKDFGSMWKNSVLQTPEGMIYGVDTTAKKIWRSNGGQVEFISDHKVTKFLNDYMPLSEFDHTAYQGHLDVKTHYNAFKHDVIFTFVKDIPKYIVSTTTEEELKKYISEIRMLKEIPSIVYTLTPSDSFGNGLIQITYVTESGTRGSITGEIQSGKVYINDVYTGILLDIESWEPGTVWSLCYNEVLGKWITFYDWYPVESCNVDNIYFSFDQEAVDDVYNGSTVLSCPLKLRTYKNSEVVDREYQISNKYFIDQTFSDAVHIYKTQNGESVPPLGSDYTKYKYISMYVKWPDDTPGSAPRAGSNTDPDAVQQSLPRVPMLNNWYFMVFETKSFNMGRITSTTGSTEIAEIKQFNLDPKWKTWDEYYNSWNREAEHLRYYDIRDYKGNRMYLWKHGQAGIYNNQGKIKPTNWYGKQHEFNFEFIAQDQAPLQKIFNNLKIVSNKTKPYKFEYEIVGEGYEWWPYKPVVYWANENAGPGKDFPDLYAAYRYILNNPVDTIRYSYPDFPETELEYRAQLTNNPYQYKKLPYLEIETTDRKGRKDRSYNTTDAWDMYRPSQNKLPRRDDYTLNTNETVIKYDEQLNEYRVHDEQLGHDMWKYGRVRGNMQYLEDFWNVEIRPLNFSWVYKGPEESITISKRGSLTPAATFSKGNYQFGVAVSDVTSITITERTSKGNKTTTFTDLAAGRHALPFTITEDGSSITMSISTLGAARFSFNLQGENVNNYLQFLKSEKSETRHRDKYIKVKVRYSGEDLAIIAMINTMFDYSMA